MTPTGLRAAAVSLRPARRAEAVGPGPRGWHASTSRSARRATRRRPSSSTRWRSSGAERGYPPSIGIGRLPRGGRRRGWPAASASRSPRPSSPPASAPRSSWPGMPHWLRLRDPIADTVLYPAVSYPSYAMGADARRCPGGARAGRRPTVASTSSAIDPADAERALCLWVNTPGNPAGGLDDLGAAAAWGRAHGVPVLSDECYVEFTWDGPARTILEHGLDGVLAVHSLSKRSNLAGVRAGFYAGDPDLVDYLSRGAQARRVHGARPGAGRRGRGVGRRRPRRGAAGPVPPPAGAAGRDPRRASASTRRCPSGGFYLWAPAPDGDAWALVRRLADRGGALVSARRVLRARRRGLRPGRRGATRRSARARGPTPGCRLTEPGPVHAPLG